MDTIIVESKASSSGTARLADTKTMGKQMSDQWIDANISLMTESVDVSVRETGRFLSRNKNLIRRKLNILKPDGTNVWYKTNKLPKSSQYE